MKKAFVFPGQGAQYTGMGKELYDSSSIARSLFEKANEILGFRITDVMFEGSAEDLKATRVTQPAIFLHSVILSKCIGDFNPDMAAGHSLGEFSALASVGAIEFGDALRLVAIRAAEMQKCCETSPGSMAAVIGLDTETIERICTGTEGLVIPANYNCDGQIVISGEREAVAKACEAMKEAGARRALPLAVGGAFHSPLMEPARAALAEAIERTVFNEPLCPVYQNFSACAHTDPQTIKDNLLAQLTNPVKWSQSIRSMIADGAGTFIELGPGNVLQGLVRKIASAEGVEMVLESRSN